MVLPVLLRRWNSRGLMSTYLTVLRTAKSRVIEWPENMEYLRPYYGQSDTAPFGLFHLYRHYGYSYQHIGKAVRDSKAFLVGISSLFTA